MAGIIFHAMPGIVGIVQGPSSAAKTKVLRMLHLLRPTEGEFGTLSADSLPAEFGWVTRPGADSKASAVWNEGRTIGIIFDGENFGPAGRHRPAELLAHYEMLGGRFFEQLNGWFSGVVIDHRNNTITLFNDRFGLNRLYYHEGTEGFYFSSEAKALLAILPQLRQIDQRSLAEFYSVGCALQNRSLFTGISLLPPASLWTFHRDGRIVKGRYFDPTTWEQQDPLDSVAYTEQLIDVFGRAAPRYFGGSRPVGMSLTGGLDSRMLLAWSNATPGTLPCYSFAGPYRDCADVTLARRLAAIVGQTHSTLRIEDDFFRDFATLAEETIRVSDGTMDVSGAVELYVNRKAREIAPVRLTGNYGSEILRSNVAFRPRTLNRSLFTSEFNQLLDLAAETYRTEAQGHRLSFIAFKQVPWHHHARYSVERSQLTPRSPFLDNELVALAYRAPPELTTSVRPLLELIAAGNPALETVPTDRGHTRGKATWRAKLKHQWQEFTAKAEYAYDYGMPPLVAKCDRLLKPFHLEKLFLGRHKFYHFRIWYRDRLRDYLHGSSAAPLPEPSCYRPGVSALLVKEHTSGSANHTSELHQLQTTRLISKYVAEQR